MRQVVATLFVFAMLTANVIFTLRTSKGDPIPWKVAKFVGLFLSGFPIVGLLFFIVLRGWSSDYGGKCGLMAALGVVLAMIVQGL